LVVFSAGVFLADLAVPASTQIRHTDENPQSVTRLIPAVIGGANCQYVITNGIDTIVPGATDIGNHCLNCGTLITLPFPFLLYDHTFNAVTVSSTGRLSFACNNEPGDGMVTCLPAPPNMCPYDFTIFALWRDWNTLPDSIGCSRWQNGCGIFTSVSGTPPNRIFNIEWHVAWDNDNTRTGNFAVRLYENDPNKRFDVIYGYSQGAAGGDAAGVQGQSGSFTQNFCNAALPQNTSRIYTCVTPTPTPTPNPTTVTTTNDSGPGSLRQVLAEANDGDTINFDPALNGQSIQLTTAELVIDKNLTIMGPGPDLLTVARSSQTQFRILHVMPGHNVTIEGLAITGGDFSSYAGGVLNDHANLTIANCSVTSNHSYAGGAIYSDGSGGNASLAVVNSSINNNQAGNSNFNSGGLCGGIFNDVGSASTIVNSTIDNNKAWFSFNFGGVGGGVCNNGTMEISYSTIRDNEGGRYGGGIDNGGTMTISDSTISGNGVGVDDPPAGDGGGIFDSGTLAIVNSTISGNYANGSNFKGHGFGGGIYNIGAVDIRNSTLSGNRAAVDGGTIFGGSPGIGNTILNAGTPENISGADGMSSHGYNVCSDDGGGFLNGPGDQINTDPMLGILQMNGGPTLTHALLPGSPAVDAGDPSFTPPPFYDQRGSGFDRVVNGRIDVGSFEAQPAPSPTCNHYAIAAAKAAIVPGTTDTGNHCIWCETLISLPFPFVLYDQTFNAVYVSSSGRLDFVCHNEPSGGTESCLPAPPYNCPYDYTIFALWYEWSTSTGQSGCSTWANGCGIFTSVSGTAPNRIFNIEWHVTPRSGSSQAGNFEVRLYENDPDKRFDITYGAIAGVDVGDSAGVQGPTGLFSQNFCNVVAPQNTSSVYTMVHCASPTPTPTPTSTPRPSPTPRVAATPRPRPTPPPRP
jgi:hypothetical protein